MRRSIFKLEIEYYFEKYTVNDGVRDDILNVLFENPLDNLKQYLLKRDVDTLDVLETKLKSKMQNDKLMSDIKSLFEVNDDLELPKSLRTHISQQGKVAIFVGAGVSKLLDIPLWEELGNLAMDFLYKKGQIAFSACQKIKNGNISPKQKMTIFHNILPRGKSKEFYEKYLVAKDGGKLSRNPYEILAKIDCPKISSNLDDEFFKILQQKSLPLDEKKYSQIYQGFDTNMEINSEAIYQVHGSYRKLEEYSIITMEDYLNNYYRDPQQKLGNFLKKLFNEYTVIFIGYGLEEFEILQHIIKDTRKHYALVGTYLDEANLFVMKKEYFEELGVEVHGYYLDFNGYDRLYDVLIAWERQINLELEGYFYPIMDEFKNVKL